MTQINLYLSRSIYLLGLIPILLLPLAATGQDTPLPPIDSQPYIVGGEDAIKGEFPYQVYITHDTGTLCGGAILNSEWVLTAAHCLISESTGNVHLSAGFQVVAGEHQLPVGNDPDEQVRGVSQVIPHPDFVFGPNISDIGLLKLDSPLTFVADLVEPIQLNTGEDEMEGELATVAGWGQLEFRGDTPETLQKVSIPIVSQATCQDAYGSAIVDSMLCAGLEEGGKDACLGDSGSPLIVPGSNGEPTQVGIVSFGFRCAEPNFPGVYTRLSSFIGWIGTYTEAELDNASQSARTFLPIIGNGGLLHVSPTPTPLSTPQAITPTPLAETPQPTETASPSPTPVVEAEISDVYLEYTTGCDLLFDDFGYETLTVPSNAVKLYANVFLEGAIGSTTRTEWFFNGEVLSQLTQTAEITEEFVFVDNEIYGDQSNDPNNCGASLPAGAYQFRFYLNDVLQKTGTASVGLEE